MWWRPPYGAPLSLLSMQQKNSMPYHRDTCTSVFINVPITKASARTQPRCPSTDERTLKTWNVATTEFCSVVRESELTQFPGQRIKLGKITVKEVTYAQKGKRHVFFPIQILASSRYVRVSVWNYGQRLGN